MDSSFDSILSSAKASLILLPLDPTLDEVAGGLSLFLSKSDFEIVCPTPMLVKFNRLIGVNKIKSQLGNKNLVIKFRGYRADGIEKVSYDIENGEFRLTVIPKQGVVAPTKDQIEYVYAGLSTDLVFLVGGKSLESFPATKTEDLDGVKLVHVGNVGIEGAGVIELARPCSSVSEAVAEIIKESKVLGEISPDVATNLLLGIEEGSDHFTHPLVSAETFATVSELMRRGGRRSAQQEKIKRESFPAGSIPGGFPTTSIEEVEMEKTPRQWFEKPQIYKGTSVN